MARDKEAESKSELDCRRLTEKFQPRLLEEHSAQRELNWPKTDLEALEKVALSCLGTLVTVPTL